MELKAGRCTQGMQQAQGNKAYSATYVAQGCLYTPAEKGSLLSLMSVTTPSYLHKSEHSTAHLQQVSTQPSVLIILEAYST